MEITNRERALATAKMQVEGARAFLHRIAKHLEENGMPGQAGNCTIQAHKLAEAGVALAFLERE
jgi:sortase (surface protein transpeptidase)